MKLYIKELYQEKALCGLKSGTRLATSLGNIRVLLLEGSFWNIYDGWDEPIKSLQNITEKECRIVKAPFGSSGKYLNIIRPNHDGTYFTSSYLIKD